MIEGHSIRARRSASARTSSSASRTARTWSIHLGMSGQLLRAKGPKDPKPKHTHVVFTFVQGGELRYVDPRTFGELYVSTPPPEGEAGRDLEVRATLDRRRRAGAAQGRCPSWRTWASTPSRTRSAGTASRPSCAAVRRRSRSVLTDQDIIAGIGNIYADEILFAAGLRFDRESEIALDDRDPTTAPRDRRDP